jgi:hypothetical protein
MKILGIDPGKNGAFVLYDSFNESILACWDMPTYKKGPKGRDAFDKVALITIMEAASRMGTDLAVLEEVGQRPTAPKSGQPRAQTGMFEFGKGWGYVDMLLSVYKLRTEYVRPQVWKKDMKCPADKEEAVFRADSLLPQHRDLWRGPRGGLLSGLAEAALLSLWGASKATIH